jgi:hypothetical protein
MKLRSKPVSLMGLRHGDCRWPVEGDGRHMRFCGEPRIMPHAYCGQHCLKAFDLRDRRGLRRTFVVPT